MQEPDPIPNEIQQTRVGGAMKGTDLVFVDTETTGLDPQIHEIIEISVVRVSQKWIAGEKPEFTVVDEWSAKVRPENIKTADPASLRVNGYTVTGWNNSILMRDALVEFSKRTAGAIMVAHNVAFDAAFIDMNLSNYELPNRMHYHRLDTVSMAYAKLHHIPDVTRFSLGELCKYFNITNTDPHSALSDARACFELFKKLLAL